MIVRVNMANFRIKIPQLRIKAVVNSCFLIVIGCKSEG